MNFSRISGWTAAAFAVAIGCAASPALTQTESDPTRQQLPSGSYQPLGSEAQPTEALPPAPQDGPLQIVPQGVMSEPAVGPRLPEAAPESGPQPAFQPQPALSAQPYDEGIIGVTTPDAPSESETPPAFDQAPSETVPAEQAPFEQAPVEQSPIEQTPGVPAPGQVEQIGGVSEIGLGAIDPASTGVLTEENGGFPVTMWQGSDRASLVALLPKLPVNTRSPTMRRLARRLLLTEADVPAPAVNQGLFSADANDHYDLLRARVERLIAAGDLSGLAALFDRLPPQIDDDQLTRYRVDVMLLNGDVAGACGEAGAANQRSENTYWFQIVALCRAIDGDASGAGFATEMLGEMGVDDPLYFQLMAYLMQPADQRDPSTIGPIGAPTPLKLAMMRIAGIEVPVETLVQASPLILRAIATTPNMPVPLRLEAADMAVRQGAIDIDMLVALYGGVQFDPSELENASLMAQAGGAAARTDALLYQAARRSPAPEARAANLEAAWQVGRNRGNYSISALANVEATRALPDIPELLNDAADVAKALLVAGDFDGAMGWYNLVRREASNANVDATARLLELWPYMQIADTTGKIPFSNEILDLWWQAQLVNTRAERASKGALLFAVFEALGNQVPQRYWTSLYEGAERADESMPALPAWRGTLLAARGGRLGETVLLSLILLGEQGPGPANPAVLSNVIEALRVVGLEKEARALAIEALAEAGL